jgi:hypothetical protein
VIPAHRGNGLRIMGGLYLMLHEVEHHNFARLFVGRGQSHGDVLLVFRAHRDLGHNHGRTGSDAEVGGGQHVLADADRVLHLQNEYIAPTSISRHNYHNINHNNDEDTQWHRQEHISLHRVYP